jgi:hypothetical protein
MKSESVISGFLIGLVVPLALSVTYALLRRLIPYQPSRDRNQRVLTPELNQELTRKYLWLNLVMFVPFLGIATVSTILLARALDSLAAWRLSGLPPSVYVVRPSWLIWLVPAMLLGILVAGVSLELRGSPLLRLLLRDPERREEYLWHSRFKFGFDARKADFGVSVFVVGACSVFFALASNWYFRCAADHIGLKRFWSLAEQRYGYDELDKIVETSHAHAPIGTVVQRSDHCLVFRDGRIWRFEDMATDPSNDVIEFLERRSGKALIHAKFIEDVTP